MATWIGLFGQTAIALLPPHPWSRVRPGALIGAQLAQVTAILAPRSNAAQFERGGMAVVTCNVCGSSFDLSDNQVCPWCKGGWRDRCQCKKPMPSSQHPAALCRICHLPVNSGIPANEVAATSSSAEPETAKLGSTCQCNRPMPTSQGLCMRCHLPTPAATSKPGTPASAAPKPATPKPPGRAAAARGVQASSGYGPRDDQVETKPATSTTATPAQATPSPAAESPNPGDLTGAYQYAEIERLNRLIELAQIQLELSQKQGYDLWRTRRNTGFVAFVVFVLILQDLIIAIVNIANRR